MDAKRGKQARAKPGAKSGLEGEGSYTAARNYDEGTRKFVARNKSEIPKMAREAEKALAGPEGTKLRRAEKAGKAKARR